MDLPADLVPTFKIKKAHLKQSNSTNMSNGALNFEFYCGGTGTPTG
jgi:hypothetical protein